MSKRLAGRFGYPEAPHEFDVTLHPDRLDEPLSWKKPRTVFVVSMGDLFHDTVPYEYIDKILRVIGLCEMENRGHTFIILTKRAKRMRHYFERGCFAIHDRKGQSSGGWTYPVGGLTNLWLGVTVENQRRADERIPLLLQCPAAVRFVSIEPMLGPINLKAAIYGKFAHWIDPAEMLKLHWVIVGGETGPGARPMRPDWARGIRDQCIAAGVPFFFKQMSSRMPIPDDLMTKEWPK